MRAAYVVSSFEAAALRASFGVVRSSRLSFQVAKDRSIKDGAAWRGVATLAGDKLWRVCNGVTLTAAAIGQQADRVFPIAGGAA